MELVCGKMAAIPPMFMFPGENKWSQPCVSCVKLAATLIRSVVASFMVKFKILLVLKRKFIFSHETVAWKNGRHSTNVHISLGNQAVPALQQLGRAWRKPKGVSQLPLSSSKSRSCWFSKESSSFIFLMKLAWTNGQHSTNTHISLQKRVLSSLHWLSRACRNV
jgi:hypothetical protein